MWNRKFIFLKTERSSSFVHPEFTKLIEIFLSITDGRYFMVMQDFETVCYDDDHFSFIIRPLQPKYYFVISPYSLKSNTPLQTFFYNNNDHVTSNYYNLV